MEKMKTLHFDWNNAISHQKAYAVIRMLENLIGTGPFHQLLQALLKDYRYRYLSFDDFKAAAEAASSQKLDWFFHDWVDTGAVACYSIQEVQQSEHSVKITIRRNGTARFPVEVRLKTQDGVQIVKSIAYQLDVQTLDFPDVGEPKRVEIDPRQICPLLKKGMEIWSR